ncbi:hypothetical protein [Ottowia sp.]|uniref:hypothetical protein n=1 Tax=Ottowia sp. TaxID=1898956 RepID=UPI002C41B903|nr:hypothetical protein [Ottowia sp.]HOB66215.1 hypothetical protein [Ottowia sp.]HPZ56697.1 hypothetical protein [Ottowia sp.]HQD47250.1 hypothetical protein [Ottowia sp.]
MKPPPDCPPVFERDMACSDAEWRRLLAQALAGARWRISGDGAAVAVGEGCLHITWQLLAPRQIALLRLPMLRARFVFEGVSAEGRAAFMRHLDLYTHRGGG